MYGEVDICNTALLRCGATSKISSLSEGSEAARALSTIYPMARDVLLQKVRPNWARVEGVLSEIPNESFRFSYAYQYPSNCLEFMYVVRDADMLATDAGAEYLGDNTVKARQQSVPFQRMSSAAGDNTFILTNKYQAIGVWVQRITDTNLFSVSFANALSSYIAAELARTLLISTKVHDSEMAKYFAFIADAENSSTNEESEEVDTSNPIAESRN